MEILLLWFGLFLLMAGVGLIVRHRREKRMTSLEDRAQAEVLGYVAGTSASRRTTFYAPVLGFEGPDGRRWIFKSDIASGSLPYPVGGTAWVHLFPGEPPRARLISPAVAQLGALLAALGLGCIGVFCSVFAASVFSVVKAALVTAVLAFVLRKKLHGIAAKRPPGQALSAAIDGALGSPVQDPSALSEYKLLTPEDIRANQRKSRSNAGFAAVLMLALSAASGFFAWRTYQDTSHLLAVGQRTQGKVVDFVASRGSRGSTAYYPVVEFIPAGSSDHVRFKHSIGGSRSAWQIGQQVTVLYDPSQLSQAAIDQGLLNWVLPAILAAVSLVTFLLSLVTVRRLQQ